MSVPLMLMRKSGRDHESNSTTLVDARGFINNKCEGIATRHMVKQESYRLNAIIGM